MIDSRGFIWGGSTGGVGIFDPSTPTDIPLSVPLTLERILVDDEPHAAPAPSARGIPRGAAQPRRQRQLGGRRLVEFLLDAVHALLELDDALAERPHDARQAVAEDQQGDHADDGQLPGAERVEDGDGEQVVASLPVHTATSIGRAPSVGLRLTDDVHVSAHHAVITWDTTLKTHVITDTNSRNGTYVDDVQVTGSVRLTNGSSIRLGMTEFIYYAPRERQ